MFGSDNKMKVLHLISGGDTGGAKTNILSLLKKLIQNGIKAELLCVIEGEFTKDAQKANIPTKIIPQKRRSGLKEIFLIKKYIKYGNYDIIHCHGARANYIGFFIKSSLKIPFITTLHSDYKLDFKDSLYKQTIFMPINAIALKRFDYILALTENFKKMLISRNFDKNKIITIYNGISFKDYPEIIPKNEFLKKYNITYSEKMCYIGIVARLQAVKGIKYFLQACKIILKENKNVMFLIAGSGDLEEDIKKYINANNIAQNVKMLGFVEDIYSFYNVLDINTLTSISEGFPYSLLEGAKMKKATISTNVGGISEMFINKNGECGILVEPKNPLAIAENMKILIENKDLRETLGKNFYNTVSENFSDEKMAQNHIDIYKRIKKEKSL